MLDISKYFNEAEKSVFLAGKTNQKIILTKLHLISDED